MTAAPVERGPADVLTPLLAIPPGASGVAVAARCGEEALVLVSGATTRGGLDPVNATTRFELGSISKTFTALLLAEMAARGEVGYEDPIDRYLPPGCRPPAPITLLHLATHSSGLPRLPPGLLRRAAGSWFTNPYRTFDSGDVLAALARTRPRSVPGSAVRYSNFGVGLLGLLLARAAGGDFGELLAARVLVPLGLTGTGCAGVPQATGYWHGRPRPPWQIPGLAPAGALRSTARDMLRYLTAHLDPAGSALAAAVAEVARPRTVIPGGTDRIGLIWNCRSRPGHELIFHSGATRGFTAFAGFSPQTHTALAALTNTGATLRGTFVQRAYEALRELAAR